MLFPCILLPLLLPLMFSPFISITNLQRQLKSVFTGQEPFHVVMSKNAVSGLVFSREAAELLLRSGVLDQLREELWELQDKETVELTRKSRKGQSTHSIPFEAWAKNH